MWSASSTGETAVDPTHPPPDYRLITLIQQAWGAKGIPRKISFYCKKCYEKNAPTPSMLYRGLEQHWRQKQDKIWPANIFSLQHTN